jgi:hypothetical protein
VWEEYLEGGGGEASLLFNAQLPGKPGREIILED